MADRIVVMGASGLVGSEVVEALDAAGAYVVAAVREAAQGAAFEAKGIETVTADYDDTQALLGALSGADRLLLSLPMAERMPVWGRVAVQAAKEAGVKYIVRPSLLGADVSAHFRLGKIHGAIDQEVEASGIPYAILRANVLYQTYITHWADQVRAGVLTVPEADAPVSRMDARDFSDCLARALLEPQRHTGRTYTLTGPEALDNHRVAEILSAVTGRSVRYEPAEVEDFGLWLEASGMPEWNIHMLLSLARHVRGGNAGYTTKGVMHLTGRPARTFATFAEEHSGVWA
ncbi:MAG: NmrA family NAD(P)-binding protein [Desulfovibrionaceae bacterium]